MNLLQYQGGISLRELDRHLRRVPVSPGVYVVTNDEKEIIYIGKGLNLRNRLRQLVRYGQRLGTNHKGGRKMWTMQGIWDDSRVFYRVVADARAEEKKLILAYEREHKQLPFANKYH